VAALSRGDIVTALHDNAPVMLLLVVAALVWGRQITFAVGGKVVEQPRTNTLANTAFGVFFLAFGLYRNTPYGAWLAPSS